MQSIIPKQCSSTTKKGMRCSKQAILGESHCRIHSRPSPKVPPGGMSSSLRKAALEAFFTAVLKISIPWAIDHLHRLYRAGKINAKPKPDIRTMEELGTWYDSLTPETQERVLAYVQEVPAEKYFKAGG
jgi:hypothetical protein